METETKQPPIPSLPTKGKGLQRVLRSVTREMYKRNYELAETNKTLSLLRQIDAIALTSYETINAYLSQTSQAIVQIAEFPFVEVLAQPLSHHIATDYVGLCSSVSLDESQTALLSAIKINDSAAWYREDKDAAIILPKDIFHFGISPPTEIQHHKDKVVDILENVMKVKSLILVKLTSREKLVGVLIFGLQHSRDSISKADLSLIHRLGSSIGVAVDSKLLFEENKRVASQLQKANEKLRALDESKDEFISMASHQLRTPLTSVKGYVSMVIDGDAGRVTKKQKDLLHQAFVSSQRMVDLIADLLNVSRLRTGKFVIEPKPTNLDELIKSEINQLTETAKAKDITLTYNKPKDFPLLMFDETKIRQVIMNFADNAIYYTPQGGHIQISLENKPEVIEFTVTDDGIGVPRSEQHHLFTKFYRANNARQARPDGTGLGLFMAKKVVVAEGGSIIFESEEGKGSTFGFVFSKSKLALPKGKISVSQEVAEHVKG